MAQAIFSAVLAAAVAVRLTPAADVAVADGHVRLADIAEVSGADAAAFAGIEIARVPGNVAALPIARVKLASLIERAIPGARVSGDLDGHVTLHSMTAPSAAVSLPYSPDTPAIERGQKLTLVSTVGPVVIQRPVVAAQSAAKSDSRLFVRTDDGEVISAPLAGGDAQ
ncbi:MAG TPA: hypothetical protein VKC17_09730 [Sphingomicrobium sp.]|nr:hypothetical protein [Sphingomicrobium sp.]